MLFEKTIEEVEVVEAMLIGYSYYVNRNSTTFNRHKDKFESEFTRVPGSDLKWQKVTTKKEVVDAIHLTNAFGEELYWFHNPNMEYMEMLFKEEFEKLYKPVKQLNIEITSVSDFDYEGDVFIKGSLRLPDHGDIHLANYLSGLTEEQQQELRTFINNGGNK